MSKAWILKQQFTQEKTVWETLKGKITVFAERFASMSNQHLICMKYSVSVDYDCEIEVVTAIDGDVWDIINGNDISKRLVNYLKPLIMEK